MLADERHAYGPALPHVQAAVAAQARDLESLLADPDPTVRASAAYAVAQAGGATDPLWTRWAAEDDPAARASVLLALARRDPERAAAAAVRAVIEGTPPERVAAGLALVRLHRPWPDGAVAAVVAALGDGARLPYPWVEEPISELMVEADDALAQALLAALTAAPQAQLRREGVWGMTARGDVWRGAPARLLPTVRPLLDDPEEEVRWSVVHALRRAGRAAGRYADDLHRIAAGYPTADPARITPESQALQTLMLLGDARWVDIVLAAPAAPPDLVSPPERGRRRCSSARSRPPRRHAAGPSGRAVAGRRRRLGRARRAGGGDR
jgi:hypothetical protein